jgi:putative zinc finger protein
MKKKETESQNHQEIQHLLPWYVNETLPAAERERVAAHLSGCSACLTELETLQVLRSAVRDSNERLPHPSEGQLDTLVARIEKSESDSPRRKIRTLAARFNEWWSALPALAKSAMIAQAVAVVVLAGASVVLVIRASRWEAVAIEERQRANLNESLLAREKKRADDYQALSGSQQDSGGTSVKITVLFREGAREKEIRDLLLSINAEFLSGPSKGGYYVIRIPEPPDSDEQSIIKDALTQLRRRQDLVQLAEFRP